MSKLAAGVLATLAVTEVASSWGRLSRRRDVFKKATERSVATGKRLMVVGDPRAGLHTKLVAAYDCGDVCVDLNGCPLCPESIAVDITQGLAEFEDDSAIVFVSCVLEYVDDIKAAIDGLLRVAGSRENLFLVYVDSNSLTSVLYPGARQRFVVTGDDVQVRPVTTTQKAVVASVLLGAFASLFLKYEK